MINEYELCDCVSAWLDLSVSQGFVSISRINLITYFDYRSLKINMYLSFPFQNCSCNQLFRRDRVAQMAEVLRIQLPALPTHPRWLRPWHSSNSNLKSTANSRKFKCHQLLISAYCWVLVWAGLMLANWLISICRSLQCIWLVFKSIRNSNNPFSFPNWFNSRCLLRNQKI